MVELFVEEFGRKPEDMYLFLFLDCVQVGSLLLFLVSSILRNNLLPQLRSHKYVLVLFFVCFLCCSIQVHYARLPDGRECAVKIQYPNLREDAEGDLKTISVVVALAKYFFPEFKFAWLEREFHDNLPLELGSFFFVCVA